MPTKPSILFLILARGGSKGLPGKNLKRIAGLSLIGFKARAALKCAACSRLMISTDSPEIQAEARAHGVEAPFTRPAELASDTATSESAIDHALRWIEDNEKRRYDAVMLLEPSSPFAAPAHFNEAITLMQDREADLVVGMRRTEPPTIFIGEETSNGSIAPIIEQMNQARGRRRQDQRPEWTMNGALYLFSWEAFRASGKIYGAPEKCFGILMDHWHSIEIEGASDLEMAEFAVEKGYLDLTPWK